MKIVRTMVGLAALACGASDSAGQQLTLEPFVASGNLNYPVGITHAGDGSGRLFITLQPGWISVYDGAQVLDDPFLGITPLVHYEFQGEEGLLGTAFHPSYQTNGFFYVYYTNLQGDNVLARYRVSATDPNLADPASGVVLLTIPHPVNHNHNGGQLQFGPDGYLYVGTGDGGGAGDPNENAQNLGSLLGKILRLDVDGAFPYAIPPGNPFVGVPGARPEIWAYGLRNPWRFSFDRQTGDLFIGDVGQALREEIDFQPAGAGGRNYGWDDMEGSLCFEPASGCLTANRVLPILEYTHEFGDCAVIGGYRYRGPQFHGLPGRYLYADACSGTLRAAQEGPAGTWNEAVSEPIAFPVSALGEDEAGEVYVARYVSGSIIYKVVGGPPALLAGSDGGIEGTGGTTTFTVLVRISPTVHPVTVRYETLPGSATPGVDYIPVSGLLTFPPSHTLGDRTIEIPIVPDTITEGNESFTLRVFDVVNAIPAETESLVYISDDDPVVWVEDSAVVEGAAPAPHAVRLHLAPGTLVPPVVQFTTKGGTAAPGVDFQPVSGSVTFPHLADSVEIPVTVLGDALVETDETFEVVLSAPVNGNLIDPDGTVTILDDDAPSLPSLEITHGAALTSDLAGGTPDFYRLAQAAHASYELLVDGVSGDLTPGLTLERLAADNVTVLQSAAAVGTGPALSLRWQNRTAGTVASQHIRVSSPACGTACGLDDLYRVRAWETTAAISRFFNASSQVTVLLLQNTSNAPMTGTIRFWDGTGALMAERDFALGARTSSTLNTAAVLGSAPLTGSITIAHDAPYGALAGKAVALEPATGFSFDSPLAHRPR